CWRRSPSGAGITRRSAPGRTPRRACSKRAVRNSGSKSWMSCAPSTWACSRRAANGGRTRRLLLVPLGKACAEVDAEHAQLPVTGVGELVPGAGRGDQDVAGLRRYLLAIDREGRLAALHHEDLGVGVTM